jgi:hypothetical protein
MYYINRHYIITIIRDNDKTNKKVTVISVSVTIRTLQTM